MWFLDRAKLRVPTPEQALPGRPDPIPTADRHQVSGAPLAGPDPDGSETAYFALGCFWGAELRYWQTPGVLVTAVGYTCGLPPNPRTGAGRSGRPGPARRQPGGRRRRQRPLNSHWGSLEFLRLP